MIFTDEPVFHPKILHQLALARPDEIVGVSGVDHRTRRHSRWNYLQNQFKFWGVKGVLINALAVTIHQLLGRMPLPTSVKGFHSLSAVCAAYRIPYRSVQNVNAREYLDFLSGQNVDLIISHQGQIFKKHLLELPRLGCINGHSALLPSYGGMKPVFWAMLNQEQEVGVTVHTMVEEIDKGVLLAQSRVSALPTRPMYSLYRDVFELTGITFLHALEVLENKRQPVLIDPSMKSSYYSLPTRVDVERFRQLGLEMV